MGLISSLPCTIGLNTYGLYSINNKTFNQSYDGLSICPKEERDIIITALRLYNAIFSVLGFIPGVRFYSGCTRILIAASIIAITLKEDVKNPGKGAITGKWHDEILLTGIGQIMRGATEAFVPYGQAVNLSIATLASFFNIFISATGRYCGHSSIEKDCSKHLIKPHSDPSKSALIKLI